MPQQENFINPYRFVKVDEPEPGVLKQLKQQQSHEKFSGISCAIEAELLTLTPLIIGGRKNPISEKTYDYDIPKGFVHDPVTKRPIIPGSSLKGSIATLLKIRTGDETALKALFGDIRGRIVKKGHVHFSDAQIDIQRSPREAHHVERLPEITTVLSSPKERHRAFYPSSNKDICVKLYHHQSKIQKAQYLAHRGPKGRDGKINTTVESPIYPLPTNCRFTFSVHLENINETQLGYILTTIFLPDGLCHKIGGAKPLGAGSVNIRPLSIEICKDAKAYYRGENAIEKYAGDNCYDAIGDYAPEDSLSPDVYDMLLWREKDSRYYRYPDYHWFKKNSQRKLRDIEDIYTEDQDEAIDIAIEALDRYWAKNLGLQK